MFSCSNQRHLLSVALNAVTMVFPVALLPSQEPDTDCNEKPGLGCQCYVFPERGLPPYLSGNWKNSSIAPSLPK